MFFSQIRQDEAANYLLDKDNGYFLDIGAGFLDFCFSFLDSTIDSYPDI